MQVKWLTLIDKSFFFKLTYQIVYYTDMCLIIIKKIPVYQKAGIIIFTNVTFKNIYTINKHYNF